ncbi:MAG TPA: hypothetical protein PLB14_08515 [Smithellaceae bacterium]|nr:hypothetical protein [Smithellaceae bacterium]HPV49737.1 hypothetical protein [Smithellaceae bacterium]
MCIWKDMDGPKKKMAGALLLFLVFGLLTPFNAAACSCAWKGPFLSVAREAPLVIVGKIVRHHPGKSPSMDVLVLETLKGGILDSGMTLQMGDGMHCRPAMEMFPVGTRWILAINGPGAKAGNGWAVSHCGEYWLRMENHDVVGSIDGEMNQVKKVPIEQLKKRFLYPRFHENFTGRAAAGKTYSRPFGSRFVFALEPMKDGWQISVREYGRDEDLARLTPPFHFAPNPREIEGWHLLANPSACVHRPYKADAGPENPRRFIFSPDVGKSILYRSETGEAEVKKVESFGRGSLKIEKFSLSDAEDGCPKIEWMDFSVRIEGGY